MRRVRCRSGWVRSHISRSKMNCLIGTGTRFLVAARDIQVTDGDPEAGPEQRGLRRDIVGTDIEIRLPHRGGRTARGPAAHASPDRTRSAGAGRAPPVSAAAHGSPHSGGARTDRASPRRCGERSACPVSAAPCGSRYRRPAAADPHSDWRARARAQCRDDRARRQNSIGGRTSRPTCSPAVRRTVPVSSPTCPDDTRCSAAAAEAIASA